MRPANTFERELHAQADAARARSYSPYSRFDVGAALALADGGVITGVNVENVSFGVADLVALGGAGADDRVQLVDEQDDAAVGLVDLWASTAFSRSSNSPRYLEPASSDPTSSAPDAAVLEALGHVTRGDPLGQALDDRGLADAGLADQHRVYTGAPRQHLDHPPHLLVAADHGVELAALGQPRWRSRPNFSSAA